MSTGNQFALIPWREQIRSGGLRAWPDAAVSILPVLAVHESPCLRHGPPKIWDSFVCGTVLFLQTVPLKTVGTYGNGTVGTVGTVFWDMV